MNLGNKQPLKDYGQIQSCQNYLKIEDEKNLKQQKNLFLTSTLLQVKNIAL
jgi:hypothetical protein